MRQWKPSGGGQRITVTQVFGAMDTGGAELRALDIVKAIDSKVVQFEFVTLTGRRGHLADQFERAGAVIVPAQLGWKFPMQFVRHLRRTRPHVLQSPVALFSGVILTLGRLAGVPIRIAHFHSDGDGKPETWLRILYRALMRWLIDKSATHIIAVSPSALACGYGRSVDGDPRVSLLPNGVDASSLAHPARSRRSGTRILSLGRAAPEKNLPRMPGVLAAYLVHDDNAQLDIVGPRSASIDNELSARAIEQGVLDRIHLQEARSDVGALLAGADVLLLTSTREGLPSVVVEAAAVGVPVVSSDVGGSMWISEAFPWVRCVSLDQADTVWAAEILEATRNRPSSEAAKGVFEASPFTLEANLKGLGAIYGIDPEAWVGSVNQ